MCLAKLRGAIARLFPPTPCLGAEIAAAEQKRKSLDQAAVEAQARELERAKSAQTTLVRKIEEMETFVGVGADGRDEHHDAGPPAGA